MDIVTHGMMGVVVASPWAVDRPEAAAAFMLGSVLPDLDAFSRVFGKRVFLRAHQTWSHAIPVIAAIGAAAALATGLPWAGLGLGLGMLFHGLLDATNTYGITLFAPFTRRRFCTEWVFFIDAAVVALTVAALGWVIRGWPEPGWKVQAAYGAALAVYWTLKALWRRRAARLGPPGALALLPSALIPWEYFGCAREGDVLRTWRISALSGALKDDRRTAILDGLWLDKIRDVPEVRLMRELSPAYHVTEAVDEPSGTRLTCRDLRTRNFGARFGEIRLRVRTEGAVEDVEFHV
ncbi:MAG TPA: metal-dependent hydrolase [Planctomycetota bacterium]